MIPIPKTRNFSFFSPLKEKGVLLLLHDDAVIWDVEDHGAGIWSFRSQTKLIPEDGSNMASEGRLGRRHPNSGKKDNISQRVNVRAIDESFEISKSAKICIWYL